MSDASDVMLAISFCNVNHHRAVLGVLDFSKGRFEYAWDNCGSNVIGVDGICQGRNGIWALSQLGNNKSGLVRMDNKLESTADFELNGYGDVHDLSVFDGKIYITDTENNRVVRFDEPNPNLGDGAVIHEFADPGADRLHINSIAGTSAGLVVSMFGPKGDRGWQEASEGLVKIVDDDRVLASGLIHPHSVIAFEQEIWWLESRLSRVYRWTKKQGSQVYMELDGYLRGLCVLGDFVFVGASARRRRSRSTGVMNTLPSGDEAAWHSWVYKIDRRNGSVERQRVTLFGSEIFAFVALRTPRRFRTADNAESASLRLWHLQDQLEQSQSVNESRPESAPAIAEIRRLIEAGNIGDAATRARSLLGHAESLAETLYLNAFVRHVSGSDPLVAEQLYRLSMQFGFSEFWVRYNLADLLAKQERIKDAAFEAARAAELEPTHQYAPVQSRKLQQKLLDSRKDQALSMVDSRQYALAETLLRPLLDEIPGWGDGMYALAKSVGADPSRSFESVRIIKRAIDIRKMTAGEGVFFVSLLIKCRLLDEAAKCLRALREEFPQDTRFASIQAEVENQLLAQKKRDVLSLAAGEDKRLELQSILYKDPNWTPGRIALASLLLEYKEIALALSLCDSGLELQPESGNLRELRAKALNLLGRTEEALAEWARLAKDQFPGAEENQKAYLSELAARHVSIALEMFDVGEWKSAVSELQQALSRNPESSEACILMATALDYAGANPDRALSLYDKALFNGADPCEVHAKRATLYFEQQNYVAAQSEAQLALELNPDAFAAKQVLYGCAERKAEAILSNARDCVNNGKLSDAEEALAPLTDAECTHAEAYYLHGCSLTWNGKDPMRAIELFDEALSRGFDEYWCRYNRALALEKIGSTAKAIVDLSRALELRYDESVSSLLKSWTRN